MKCFKFFHVTVGKRQRNPLSFKICLDLLELEMKIINFSPHPWRGVEAMTLNGADCLAWQGRPGRKDSSSSSF